MAGVHGKKGELQPLPSHMVVSFGSGTSTAGSLSSGLSTITPDSRGNSTNQSNGDKNKDAQKDLNKQHRKKHPGRYGSDAKKHLCRTASRKCWQKWGTSLL